MHKLSSLEEFDSFQAALIAERDPSIPTIVIPAVAASAALIYTQANPGFHIDEQRADKDGCEQRTTRVLRATDGDRVLWSRKLTDIVSICGPP